MAYFPLGLRSVKQLLVLMIVLVTCFLPTVQAVADVNYNDVCVQSYDCALYDPAAPCSSAPSADLNSGANSPVAGSSSLTTEQKIAQTFIVGFDASTPKSVITGVVTKYKIGGIYLLGTKDAKGAGFTKDYFDSLNKAAGTPLTIASDEEGGLVQRFDYPDIAGGAPSAKALGNMTNIEVKKIGGQMAKQLKADGVTVDLAPVLDLNDGRNIISHNSRSFSGDPIIVGERAAAFAQGLQDGGITPVFKHFPGFGGAGSGNTDTTAVTTPDSYDLAKNLKPYKKVLGDSGTSGVMLSNIIVSGLTNGKPASISPAATNYIRNTLNYTGPITTDDLAVLSKYGSNAVGLSAAITASLKAGVTMPLFGIGTSDQAAAESKIGAAIDAVKADVPVKLIGSALDQIKTFKGGAPSAPTAAVDTAGAGVASTCCPASNESVPAGSLPSFIPEPYNGAFTKGASAHNVAPALIAALFSEENALGGDTHNPNPPTAAAGWAAFVKRHTDPNSGWATSSASAQGPFQFISGTWTGLGYDIKDINNLAKSADAAGKYAQTEGATQDKPSSQWKKFIFAYNHADWYVAAVLKYYEYYNSQPGAVPGGATTVISNNLAAPSDVQAISDCAGTVSGSVRQQIAGLAQQELDLWKKQPGYDKAPNFPYAQTGYLKYSQNRKEEWCADFVSWIYKQAGKPLGPGGNWAVPYVPNLQIIGEKNQGFHWHTPGDGYTPQPGDLAIHGGKHVNILVSVSGNKTTYIGGDQGPGPYPGGSIVSIEIGNGYYSGGVTGYVTPD